MRLVIGRQEWTLINSANNVTRLNHAMPCPKQTRGNWRTSRRAVHRVEKQTYSGAKWKQRLIRKDNYSDIFFLLYAGYMMVLE